MLVVELENFYIVMLRRSNIAGVHNITKEKFLISYNAVLPQKDYKEYYVKKYLKIVLFVKKLSIDEVNAKFGTLGLTTTGSWFETDVGLVYATHSGTFEDYFCRL